MAAILLFWFFFYFILLLISIIGTLANYYWIRKNAAIVLLQVLNIIVGGAYTGIVTAYIF